MRYSEELLRIHNFKDLISYLSRSRGRLFWFITTNQGLYVQSKTRQHFGEENLKKYVVTEISNDVTFLDHNFFALELFFIETNLKMTEYGF